MKNLEKRRSPVTSVLGSSKLAPESGGNFSMTMEGVVTDSATARHGIMLAASGCPNLLPSAPEDEEDAENDDYAWMDDMEAAGAAPA